MSNSAVQTPDDDGGDRTAAIRKWLAILFMHTIRVAERLLEDGHLATAAVMLANATLLSDRADTFVAAVQRVYPSYFYRLYKCRMFSMGYEHLFPKTGTTETTVGHQLSPVDGLRTSSDDNRHTSPAPPSPPPVTK